MVILNSLFWSSEIVWGAAYAPYQPHFLHDMKVLHVYCINKLRYLDVFGYETLMYKFV